MDREEVDLKLGGLIKKLPDVFILKGVGEWVEYDNLYLDYEINFNFGNLCRTHYITVCTKEDEVGFECGSEDGVLLDLTIENLWSLMYFDLAYAWLEDEYLS